MWESAGDQFWGLNHLYTKFLNAFYREAKRRMEDTDYRAGHSGSVQLSSNN